jgi:Fe-Mn family superoxide dismutase
MSFTLPELPYDKSAFGKAISVETFDYHYGKHHQTYVNNLNQLVKGTQWDGKSLDDIVVK